MSTGTILFLLLLLACPLMMVWMMRGGHGAHGAHGGRGHAGHGCVHHGGGDEKAEPEASIAELRARREELDQLIEERESAEHLPAAMSAADASRNGAE